MSSPTQRCLLSFSQDKQKDFDSNKTSTKLRFETQNQSMRNLRSLEKEQSSRIFEVKKNHLQETLCKSSIPKLNLKEKLYPKVSPENYLKNSKTHPLEESHTSQQTFDAIQINDQWTQKSMFQTNRSIIPQNLVDCEGFDSHERFTTFRRELNEQSPSKNKQNVVDNKANWKSKTTCLRRLSFESTEKVRPIEFLRIDLKVNRVMNADNQKCLKKATSNIFSPIETKKSSIITIPYENNQYPRDKTEVGNKKLKILPLIDLETPLQDGFLPLSPALTNRSTVPVIKIQESSHIKINIEDKEIKLKKAVMALKQKIIQKDLEVLELKDGEKKEEIETKILSTKLNQALTDYKHSDEHLEQIMYQATGQEREVAFLNVSL